MKCLESGMNDLAGEQSDHKLVATITATPVVIVLNMLSQR